MNAEDFIKGFEPVMKMAVESDIWVKTIARHYKKTISELTGKSEEAIKDELNVIFEEIKEEQIKNIQKDGNKS